MQVQTASQVLVCSSAKKTNNSYCQYLHSVSPDTFSTVLMEFLSFGKISNVSTMQSFSFFGVVGSVLWRSQKLACQQPHKYMYNTANTRIKYYNSGLSVPFGPISQERKLLETSNFVIILIRAHTGRSKLTVTLAH